MEQRGPTGSRASAPSPPAMPLQACGVCGQFVSRMQPPSLQNIKSSQIWCRTEGVTRGGLPHLTSYLSDSHGSWSI